MTRSMTGYASLDGSDAGWTWTWEMRGVNGRGLDIRLRLPEQIEGVEVGLRAEIQSVAKRGNISVSLRISRDDTVTSGTLSTEALEEALTLIDRVTRAATDKHMILRETNAADILGMRGVLETRTVGQDNGAFREALLEDIKPLVAAFDAMRASEGQALAAVIRAQIDEIEGLAKAARSLVEARAEHMREAHRAALARVVESVDTVDEDRIAQELALIAVKADVTEELDRLDAHVVAARDLMAEDGAKGRKLDFLVQEFNREANTLCSKAQYSDLTRIGLDLKHTIDQMREQVQNVE